MSRWTVFLDRDGTLNVDQVHGVDIGKLVLRPRAREAMQRWRSAGWRLILVTNQSGIARGRYTETQMHAFHGALESALGATFDGVYFCPHLPDAGCACRKPRAGLLVAAAKEHGIAPERSFLIGDSPGDILAARAFGARSVLVPSRETEPVAADAIAGDIEEAALWTLRAAGVTS